MSWRQKKNCKLTELSFEKNLATCNDFSSLAFSKLFHFSFFRLLRFDRSFREACLWRRNAMLKNDENFQLHSTKKKALIIMPACLNNVYLCIYAAPTPTPSRSGSDFFLHCLFMHLHLFCFLCSTETAILNIKCILCSLSTWTLSDIEFCRFSGWNQKTFPR